MSERTKLFFFFKLLIDLAHSTQAHIDSVFLLLIQLLLLVGWGVGGCSGCEVNGASVLAVPHSGRTLSRSQWGWPGGGSEGRQRAAGGGRANGGPGPALSLVCGQPARREAVRGVSERSSGTGVFVLLDRAGVRPTSDRSLATPAQLDATSPGASSAPLGSARGGHTLHRRGGTARYDAQLDAQLDASRRLMVAALHGAVQRGGAQHGVLE